MEIDTLEVLEAAGTKWNFLPFRPGLVGGHCISVDPYYLMHKSQEIGHHPQILVSGRRINDQMGCYVADTVAKMMTQRRIHVVNAKILILGLTFKENCPDLRNTRVVDIIDTFVSYNAKVDVYDPWVTKEAAQREFGLNVKTQLQYGDYDAIVLAVAHHQFTEMGAEGIRKYGKEEHILYDIKSQLAKCESDARL